MKEKKDYFTGSDERVNMQHLRPPRSPIQLSTDERFWRLALHRLHVMYWHDVDHRLGTRSSCGEHAPWVRVPAAHMPLLSDEPAQRARAAKVAVKKVAYRRAAAETACFCPTGLVSAAGHSDEVAEEQSKGEVHEKQIDDGLVDLGACRHSVDLDA